MQSPPSDVEGAFLPWWHCQALGSSQQSYPSPPKEPGRQTPEVTRVAVFPDDSRAQWNSKMALAPEHQRRNRKKLHDPWTTQRLNRALYLGRRKKVVQRGFLEFNIFQFSKTCRKKYFSRLRTKYSPPNITAQFPEPSRVLAILKVQESLSIFQNAVFMPLFSSWRLKPQLLSLSGRPLFLWPGRWCQLDEGLYV